MVDALFCSGCVAVLSFTRHRNGTICNEVLTDVDGLQPLVKIFVLILNLLLQLEHPDCAFSHHVLSSDCLQQSRKTLVLDW